MRLVSPSKLDMYAECPRYTKREGGDSPELRRAAEEGTMLHEATENILQGKDPMQQGLTDGQIQDVMRCVDMVNSLRAYGFTRILVEQELESSVTKRGRADVVMLDDAETVGAVEDHKFVKSEGNSFDLQLKGYAVCMFETYPTLQTVTTCVCAPRLDLVVTQSYDRGALDQLREDILSVQRAVNNPFVPPRVCSWCGRCEFNGQCPAQSTALAPVAACVPMPIPAAQILNPQTPEDWSAVLLFGGWLEDWYDQIKQRAKEVILAGTEVPFFRVIERAGSASVAKAHMPVVYDRLKELGYSHEELLGACEIALGQLAKHRAEACGADPKQLLSLVHQVLGDLVQRGAPVRYVAKTKRKPERDLYRQLQAGGPQE